MTRPNIRDVRKIITNNKAFLAIGVSLLVEEGFKAGRQHEQSRTSTKVVSLSGDGLNRVPLSIIEQFRKDVAEALAVYNHAITADLDDVPLGELGGVFFGPSERESAERYAIGELKKVLPKAMVIHLLDPSDPKANELINLIESFEVMDSKNAINLAQALNKQEVKI